MSAIRAYEQLTAALNDLRSQWRRRQVVEGLLLTIAIALAALVIVVLKDNLFQPGSFVRLVLALFLFGVTGVALLHFVVRRVLEDRRDDFFAALVEEKNPALRNRLINALQLGRGDQRGHSTELIEAIVNDAAHSTADLEMNRSLDARPLKRAGLLALIALVIVGGYTTFFGARFSNGAARVLMPFADIPAYTSTRIPAANVLPGDKRVPEGDTFVVEARIEGTTPGEAFLHRATGDRELVLPMQPDPNAPEVFRIELRNVVEPFAYFIRAGDGRSRVFHIDVVKRPQVQTLRLRYEFPAYAELASKELRQDDGQINAIAGTAVTVEIQSSKPLKSARLVVQQGKGEGLTSIESAEPALVLQRGKDDQTWSGTFVLGAKDARLANLSHPLVMAPDQYQVQLLDTDGYTNADPLWRPIHLQHDQAPSVAIERPRRDQMPVKPTDKMEIAVESRDDFGVGAVTLHFQVGDEQPRILASRQYDGHAQTEPAAFLHTWDLTDLKLKGGELVRYWATATDRNNITGPGKGESRKYSLIVISPEMAADALKNAVGNYAAFLEELIRRQTETRTATNLLRPDDDDAERKPALVFAPVVKKQTFIRARTGELARAMESDGLPLVTMVQELDALRGGLMATAVKLLEQGRDSDAAVKAEEFAKRAVPVQDEIIEELKKLLVRLQRNEQAKKELARLAKTDKPTHDKLTAILQDLIKNLDKHVKDSTELASKFERLPKKVGDDFKKDEIDKVLKEYDEFSKRTEKWTKDTVNEMTKLPTGFVDDFGLRKDANRIFEEIEAKARGKAEKLEVSLEDLGAGLGTKMKEDLEMWLPDAADSVKWVQEEPLNQKPFKVPEMPLPKALEDLIGDLLQKAEEFDEEADDVTSAWGDNLDQAGWGVSDGPISSFSAKGKTGNDQPNSQEVTGRSGDGRRGKSAGQMVGDSSRALPGRKTPARVGNEKYEPGSLKQEASQDPNGATGGGKKAGAGRIGLQGGTPPDITKDVGRLNEKQMGLREKAEQVARKLEEKGYSTIRLREAIELMKPIDADNRDLRYDDLAKRRREALQKLKGSFGEIDPTAASINRARDLPPELRKEMLQGHDEGYPAGYENLLKNYYKKLSTDGK